MKLLSKRKHCNMKNWNQKKIKLIFLFFIGILCSTNVIYANILDKEGRFNPDLIQQGITITGNVNDETGAPMPGVNVTIQGTLQGVVTDIDGKYSIVVPNTDAILVYSFVGHATRESLVGNQTVINITLIEDTRELEEVVVVGYGTQKKVNLTGSISSLSGDELM